MCKDLNYSVTFLVIQVKNSVSGSIGVKICYCVSNLESSLPIVNFFVGSKNSHATKTKNQQPKLLVSCLIEVYIKLSSDYQNTRKPTATPLLVVLSPPLTLAVVIAPSK